MNHQNEETSMDKTARLFDNWADENKDLGMEDGHRTAVLKLTETITLDKPFSFLDIGCGNGWLVRQFNQHPLCTQAMGIDKSSHMIQKANTHQHKTTETYDTIDLLHWDQPPSFDLIFAMEALYYCTPIRKALGIIYNLLNKNGTFYFGADFYKENTSSHQWADQLQLPMALHSIAEWKQLFNDQGFDTTTTQVTQADSDKKWKQTHGTLFINGKKR